MSDANTKPDANTKAAAQKGTRCIALVGPQSSGKTTLLESLLAAAGAIPKKGNVTQGTTVGDASFEARARHMSTELTPARFSYLGDPWVVLDCPGAVDLSQDARQGMLTADAVIVVTDPDAERMLALGPIFRFLDDHKIPHMLFINKMDTITGPVRDLLAAAQRQSSRPLVLRHIPLVRGQKITGYVDLVAERAYHYELDKPSERIPLEKFADETVPDSRRELIEKLSDFDDALLEKLLEDMIPDRSEVYRQLTKDLQEDLIVPVLIGAAEHDHGVRRLMKALRHEVPAAAVTAARLGIPEVGVVGQIYKLSYVPHVGRLSLIRLWRGSLKDGDTLANVRISNIHDGAEPKLGKARLHHAAAGDFIALSKLDAGLAGTLLLEEHTSEPKIWSQAPTPLYGIAITAKDRKDDVRLGEALHKVEEDPSLSLQHVNDTGQTLLRGQGDLQLQIALDRLKRKFDLSVDTRTPQVPYRETIRKGIVQHARHKRQSGGHGQFADIKVEIQPLPRGEGFIFTDAIVGGVVPRNFIPGVEAGLRDNIMQGPLGFPVVDLNVKLFDGQYHSVDSSDQAFRTAARQALTEGLPQCDPVLLEPICEVNVYVPTEFTSKVQRTITQHRAQILGFNAREGWDGWDVVQVNMPEAEMQTLITEIRSVSQGTGTYNSHFSHYQELIGRDAEKVTRQRKEALAH